MILIRQDTLISSGPIDEVALKSSVIKFTESTPQPMTHCLSFVRILFEYQNRQEDLIYPVIQCDSWFVSWNHPDSDVFRDLISMLGTAKQARANTRISWDRK